MTGPSPAPGPTRRLRLEGAWNFRDLGGYLAADGRSVRWRRLFRADGLDRLSEADLAQLAGLGLRTVVDLRTGDEVAGGRIEAGSGGVAWHHLPMLDVLPPRRDYDEWVVAGYVADQYLGMLEGAPEMVASFLRLLAEPDSYPLVYHCFAGKDRTGILSALVLGLLGVSDADIAGDYALSGEAMGPLLAWMRSQAGGTVEQLERIESSAAAIVAAEPETMATFLERFRAGHGSFDDYAARLGLPGIGPALRDILLEG